MRKGKELGLFTQKGEQRKRERKCLTIIISKSWIWKLTKCSPIFTEDMRKKVKLKYHTRDLGQVEVGIVKVSVKVL